MSRAVCAWCDEYFDDVNGYITEDGKNHCCSEECLNSLEQNLAENAEQNRYERTLRERGD